LQAAFASWYCCGQDLISANQLPVACVSQLSQVIANHLLTLIPLLVFFGP
jgi:hypothetical protein